MKKMGLPLKVFLIVLGIGVLYVLIASIVRASTGQIEIGMALTRFIIGSIISVIAAGIAAGITALVVAIRQKKKLNLPLIVFLIGAIIAVLYVLIRTIIRVSTGEISTEMAVIRFIIGSIMYVAGAGVLAGITALVIAFKKLGE